jgi:hypothetical protein
MFKIVVLFFILMQKIHLIEQNDMSIDEYYSAFDRLMGPLLSMVPQCIADECTTQKFIEKFLTYRFVMGLRADFEAIRTRLLHDLLWVFVILCMVVYCWSLWSFAWWLERQHFREQHFRTAS